MAKIRVVTTAIDVVLVRCEPFCDITFTQRSVLPAALQDARNGIIFPVLVRPYSHYIRVRDSQILDIFKCITIIETNGRRAFT